VLGGICSMFATFVLTPSKSTILQHPWSDSLYRLFSAAVIKYRGLLRKLEIEILQLVGQTQSPYALSHRCVACQYEVSKICRLSQAQSNHRTRYRCSSTMDNPSVPMSYWLSTATILKSGSNDRRTARNRASFHRTICRKNLSMTSRSE
jgi:hypothetical protein